jgi:hypothetical protein
VRTGVAATVGTGVAVGDAVGEGLGEDVAGATVAVGDGLGRAIGVGGCRVTSATAAPPTTTRATTRPAVIRRFTCKA